MKARRYPAPPHLYAIAMGSKGEMARVIAWVRAMTPDEARAKAGAILRQAANNA